MSEASYAGGASVPRAEITPAFSTLLAREDARPTFSRTLNTSVTALPRGFHALWVINLTILRARDLIPQEEKAPLPDCSRRIPSVESRAQLEQSPPRTFLHQRIPRHHRPGFM
jgi:hypothetical protein